MSTFYRHNQSPIHHSTHKHQYTTADKFYDLEESQRRFHHLTEENLWLKQQLEKNRHLDATNCPYCEETPLKQVQGSTGNDIVYWNMMERNKYLQNKIDRLRGQHQKQSRVISSIKDSDKWKNRFNCSSNANSCYEDKYLQLLRVRSPFY